VTPVPDPSADTPLPPEQDAVRRLLADARHTGPPPPEVVARLEESLAGLVAERAASHDEGSTRPVTDLGARRRRAAGIGLLAAAAVVVAGVALGQGLPTTGGGGDSASSGAGADRGTSMTEQQDSAGAEGPSADGSAGLTSPSPRREITPQSGSFAVSTADPALPERLVALRPEAGRPRSGSADASVPCAGGGVSGGRRLDVDVDGRPGVVVFRRPEGDVQRVELYTCDDPAPVRTLTVPAP
jgi:hypothetical protein